MWATFETLKLSKKMATLQELSGLSYAYSSTQFMSWVFHFSSYMRTWWPTKKKKRREYIETDELTIHQFIRRLALHPPLIVVYSVIKHIHH